ncbi:uncharacterized protein LOC110694144 [Chenopodium quinoa]|uniref:uncharacterized protein LOC110694144 n=1 Tax=Chenopodium quinoa TaxID=63459 RepID=UPI000B791A1D|nr:uncharacterized protein LOC110694144 [Chenopodium quinoa]
MANIQEYAAVKVMFSNNVQATLSVKLINGDGEDPAGVYGNINGRFGIGSQFSLFAKQQSQRIEVRPGEFIPLSRSDVNVPEEAKEMEIEAYINKTQNKEKLETNNPTFATSAQNNPTFSNSQNNPTFDPHLLKMSLLPVCEIGNSF